MSGNNPLTHPNTMKRAIGLLAMTLAGMFAISLLAEDTKRKGQPTTRNVQGTVTGSDGMFVVGAVVQLKDARSLQVRSFISQENGAYHFSGLKVDNDYDLKADFSGMTSGWKRLSIFDTRAEPVMNLKLDKKEGPAK